MHLKTLIAWLSLAAALCAASVALADAPIYKWIDDQGRVHYSTEPHGDKPQQLAIPNQGAASPPATTAPGAASAAASQQAQQDAQLVQAQSTDSPTCKAGRDRLAKYLQADNLYKLDDKGAQVPLSADDKQKALADARAYVTRNCGGGGT
jgi:hypothetical protein